MPPTRRPRPRHEVVRIRERASYDRATAHAILDAGLVAHVAFATGAQPFVIPMLYARDGDALLLHGSVASRLTGALAEGVECCIAVTHLDGLVLARSHFHHSANYRSVVAFGRAVAVTDAADKVAALARFVDFVLPGRAADTRAADAAELAATTVLRMPIADCSVKVRTGGAKDHPDDLASPAWAGVLPLAVSCGTAQPDTDAPLPGYLERVLARGIEGRHR
jgi:uncharacterized protein